MSMEINASPALQLARHLRGATLLEALVTLLVVSFGMLGIAGLLLSGIRANAISSYRSTAMYQAYEIADRMRSNIVGTRDGAYDLGAGSSAACEPSTGSCTPADQARSDLYAGLGKTQPCSRSERGSPRRQNPVGQNCSLVVDQAWPLKSSSSGMRTSPGQFPPTRSAGPPRRRQNASS
ncbi:MAG: type IV pilus modification protein PilV [Chromatiales bacterium]|nr:type IV pilus modification protein PilV [Chromatiales bacterium]